MTVPGVGPLTALAFRATIDQPRRFRKSRDVVGNALHGSIATFSPLNIIVSIWDTTWEEHRIVFAALTGLGNKGIQ